MKSNVEQNQQAAKVIPLNPTLREMAVAAYQKTPKHLDPAVQEHERFTATVINLHGNQFRAVCRDWKKNYSPEKRVS